MLSLLQYPNMILERHRQKINEIKFDKTHIGKAEKKVCSAHTISMNTTLPLSHINQKENNENHIIQLILTIDVSPRDSQDDNILPKHIKINPKVFFSDI